MGEGIEQIECRFRVVAIHTIAVSQDCRGHAAATDLPDKDDAAKSLMTGGGVDAMLLVSVVKGAWTEDVDKLQRERGITMGYWTPRVAGTSDDRGRRGGTSKIGGGKRIGRGAGAGRIK